MRAVLKREFSSAFHRIYAYVAIALSLLISAVVFSANNLTYSTESIGGVVSFMSFVTLLIIPVIAASVVPSEKYATRDKAYDALPLTARGVALGKFFAALLITLISDAFLIFFPFLSGFFGAADHLISYTAILGYVLFQAAWLALCLFIFKSVKKRWAAYVTVYGVAFGMMLVSVFIFFVPLNSLTSVVCLGILAAAVGTVAGVCVKRVWVGVAVFAPLAVVDVLLYVINPNAFAGLFERVVCQLSPIDRFNPFIYGIFDVSGVIYYLSLALAFVWLFARLYSLDHEKREAKPSLSLKKITSAGVALLLVVTLGCVNVAALAVPNRFKKLDASLADKASLSDDAKNYLASVDKDVTFYLLEPTSRDMDYTVSAETYSLYIDRVVGANERFSLVEVYYEQTPEFYEEKGIIYENVVPNSLVIECGERYNYVSYYSFLYYSNADMGATKMSLSEYLYALQLYSSNEQYAQYLYSLMYNTTVYSYADLSICQVVEYVVADIIPNNYYMTGHGEPDTEKVSSPFHQWGLELLDVSDGIPEDAASIFINMPSEDITESERDILLEYLEGGGQLTFVTNEKNLDMPNLCAILEAYGMTVENNAFVNEPLGEGDEERETTQIYPNVDFKNEIFGSINSTASIEPVVKNANAISMNEDAKGDLLIYPLLRTSEESYLGDNAEAKASYTVACAAETGDGARVVWFTGGESYNEAASIGANLVAYGLTWVTLEYTSAVSELPPVLYAQPTTIVSSGGATLITVLLCLIAIGVAVYGVTVIYKRKKLK